MSGDGTRAPSVSLLSSVPAGATRPTHQAGVWGAWLPVWGAFPRVRPRARCFPRVASAPVWAPHVGDTWAARVFPPRHPGAGDAAWATRSMACQWPPCAAADGPARFVPGPLGSVRALGCDRGGVAASWRSAHAQSFLPWRVGRPHGAVPCSGASTLRAAVPGAAAPSAVTRGRRGDFGERVCQPQQPAPPAWGDLGTFAGALGHTVSLCGLWVR